jgi:hypothetical protein
MVARAIVLQFNSENRMFKTKFAIIIAAGLTLAPAQLLAQGVGGSALPPRPGDRAAPTGSTALPARPGQRVGSSSSGGVGGSAPPANPGGPSATTGASNGTTGR